MLALGRESDKKRGERGLRGLRGRQGDTLGIGVALYKDTSLEESAMHYVKNDDKLDTNGDPRK